MQIELTTDPLLTKNLPQCRPAGEQDLLQLQGNEFETEFVTPSHAIIRFSAGRPDTVSLTVFAPDEEE